MTNTNTDDIEASVAQCRAIAEAGGEIVRLTAQGVKEADNIGRIRSALRKQGCQVPLVADIHFNTKAAFAAAAVTDKVRINPGNFVDPARTFKQLTYTDEAYEAELQRIHDALVPFIALCREHHTAGDWCAYQGNARWLGCDAEHHSNAAGHTGCHRGRERSAQCRHLGCRNDSPWR